MNLIKRKTLLDFWTIHPETQTPLTAWISMMMSGTWKTMAEVQANFSKAKVLNAERVRFEVCGGKYRLVAAFVFNSKGKGTVFIKFIGTHAQYDKVDALTVSEF